MVQGKKQIAAQTAVKYIPENSIIGIGSGSTVDYLIQELATIKNYIKGAVAASTATEKLLKKHDIETYDLNAVGSLPLYIDGADAYNSIKQLVKGQGGALTREKIIANCSEQFICIVDNSKTNITLSDSPIPIEIIPMARSFVAREIVKLSGTPVYRENFITDNGNIILDIFNLVINEPINLEEQLNNIPGIVENGLFAKRGADIIIVGGNEKASIIDHSG